MYSLMDHYVIAERMIGRNKELEILYFVDFVKTFFPSVSSYLLVDHDFLLFTEMGGHHAYEESVIFRLLSNDELRRNSVFYECLKDFKNLKFRDRVSA